MTVPQQSANDTAVQTSIQRSFDSSVTIQRQSAPTPATSGTQFVVARPLSWADFHLVPTRIGGYSAGTKVKGSYRKNGTGFNVAFDPAASWSVLADQTAALLRHEQYHLNLAVLIANKANTCPGRRNDGSPRLGLTPSKPRSRRTKVPMTATRRIARTLVSRLCGSRIIDAEVPEFPITT
jgi:hypothetical protein